MSAADRRAEIIRRGRLRALGVKWESPCRRWTLTGGGPKNRGCVYTLRDTQTGETREFRTRREAADWVGEQSGQPVHRVVVSGMPSDRRMRLDAPPALRGERRVGQDRDYSSDEIERRYDEALKAIKGRRQA